MLADEKQRWSLERGEAFGVDVRRHQRFRSLIGVVEALDRLIEERQVFASAPKFLAECALQKDFRDGTRSRLRRGDAFVGNAGERVGQHQAVDALRMSKGKAKRIVAADRLADHVSARDVQMIEQQAQIVAKDSRVARRGSVRKPESAQVQDKASIVPRQCRDLLPPAQVIAAAAMQEHDAGTFAILLIVEARIWQLETRHSVPRSVKRQWASGNDRRRELQHRPCTVFRSCPPAETMQCLRMTNRTRSGSRGCVRHTLGHS